jgi:hypothetical protein
MPRIIKIKGIKPGFRRCGIAHSSEWTEYPVDRFTPDELAKLKAEPLLVVVEEEKIEQVKQEPGKKEAKEKE